MRQMRYLLKSALGAGLLGLTLVALSGVDAHAQTDKPGEPQVRPPTQQGTSGFTLFGNRDFAVGGFRLAGDWGGCTDNSSNLTTPVQCFFNNFEPLFHPDWFDLFFYFAAPPSEWNKHKQTVPSLDNARGKGYTVNSALTQYSGEVLPHDGTLGPFHAGAQTTTDGSCQDFTTDFWGAGNPLLAHNDCTVTWGSQGWQGSRIVDADGFLGYAAQVGDMNFTFDPFLVPEELQRNDKFLGSVQSFGFFSDYSIDALFGSSTTPSYGNVIPEALGGDPGEDPTRTGWPLGLQAKMDAFSFSAPGMTNTAWWQITVTNNSADVYGVGLDYDSLYMGLQPGWLTFNQGTSNYRDPANGVVRGATFCTSGPACGPGGDPQHPADQWGSAPPAGVGAGFNYGAAAIVVMKSPIGDLRNKKFTDPASPFFGKGDPAIWDDTITFNHGHMCGFHGCSAVVWNADAPDPPIPANNDYEQRQFGMVSSITPDVAGDRNPLDPGSIPEHTTWDTWRWEEFPDRNQLDFNSWVPGGWDYNDDGIPDTLHYDDCSDNAGAQLDPVTGLSKRCAVTWSDTLPGGFGNVYSNRGAVTGVGPISLDAGETVQWVIALVHATDSLTIESDIATAIDHYQAFYLGPEPPTPNNITSVDIRQGGTTAGPGGEPAAQVTLYLDDESEQYEDPFLAKFLTDLEAADEGTELGNIRLLNPALDDTIQARIGNNVAALHLFKSCDGGTTFTDDGDCFGDPASGGIFGGVGWNPYRTLEASIAGEFPNTIVDDNVFGGRTFLYSLVAESRGLSVSVQTGEVLDTIGGEIVCSSGCGSTNLAIAPKLIQTIATATGASNVASVYVPVGQQSGFRPVSVELMQGSPDFIPFERMGISPTRDEVTDGQFSLLFGDSVSVTQYATVEVTGVTVDSTVVTVTDLGPDTTVTLATALGEVAIKDAPTTETIDTINGRVLRTRVSTFTGLTSVLADPSDRPLTVTGELDGDETVPGTFFGLSNYPGFQFTIDNTVGGQFDQQFYEDAAGTQIGPLVEPAVTFRPDLASGVAFEGTYRVTWLDRAYGPGSPFTLDFNDPEGTRQAVLDALEARETQTASTDALVASLIGVPAEELAATELPFVIENVTGDSPQPVTVAVQRSGKQRSALLGDALDTLVVTVPETQWLPGDVLTLVEGEDPNLELTFAQLVLGCDPAVWARLTCNPVSVASRGGTGYISTQADQELLFSYFQTITPETEYTFRVQSAETGEDLLATPEGRQRIRASLDSVKVVPNPFIMFSQYSTSGGEERILFTHAPPRGVLRIFTVAGQFVQSVTWEPEDLNGRGDLAFNLRTREGNEMAAGLYLYVLTALNNGGGEMATTRGKFVIIK